MSSYTGPTFDAMMPELIQALKNLGGSGSINEINQECIRLLNLSDEVVAFPHSRGNRSEVEYRLAWTRTFLKKTGYVDNASRGIWILTSKGNEADHVNPGEIVRQVRAMAALTSSSSSPDLSNDDDLENDGIELPEEIQTWRDKLRNVLLNLNPDAFEHLAQQLLRAAGFTQVIVTGRTGDGGIDGTGIIKLNGMISFHMLFQCKRYQGSVSAGEMRDFRGAMQGRADKGLFITTGKFTNAAMQEANRPGTTPIDVIDGESLIDMLKDLKLGVKPVTDYQVNEEWFASL